MNIIFWIAFGAIIGWLASIFTNSSQTLYGKMSVVIGAFAALLGGWAVYIISNDQFATLNVYAIVGASIFAVGVLWLREKYMRR